MTTKPLNIYQRISAIMADISNVAKEDKKVNNQYTFVSHDAVTAALHPLLVEHGVVAVPSVTERTQDGNRTDVTLETTFVNIDNPEDKISIISFGYGIDQQDKGPGKAVSYAYKYGLLKMFALGTGDDPEKDNVEHKPAEQQQDPAKEKAAFIKGVMAMAKTPEEVHKVWNDGWQHIKAMPEGYQKQLQKYRDDFISALTIEAG